MENLLQVALKLGVKRFKFSFGIDELDKLFGYGIQSCEVQEIVAEGNCYETELCHKLLAEFLQDESKEDLRAIYVDSNNSFNVDRLRELIRDKSKKTNANLERILVKKLYDINEFLDVIESFLKYCKGIRVCLLIVNNVCGIILSQDKLYDDLSTKRELIIKNLHRLAKNEGLAILTINSFAAPLNNEIRPLLGNVWVNGIYKRVSLHPDHFVSGEVGQKIYFARKYVSGDNVNYHVISNNIVRYQRKENGIELFQE
uniref:RECA_2 domain-containing protein n=1 Tax=Parastrongyloides trichosuri TaxID=131310 RepID=A0A0N4ZEG2_PARTI